MENYQPNSHKFKEEKREEAERKKTEKVIGGTARIKKKSEIRKLTDTFISEDASKVKSHLIDNLFVPGAKKLIVNAIKIAAEMIFGETGDRDRGGSYNDRGLPYVSYNKISTRRDDYRPYSDARGRAVFDYGDIILDSKGDAEYVLGELEALIEEYGSASVTDLYGLIGVTDHNYLNAKYGWTRRTFYDAHSVRLSDGSYKLKLPRVIPLD